MVLAHSRWRPVSLPTIKKSYIDCTGPSVHFDIAQAKIRPPTLQTYQRRHAQGFVRFGELTVFWQLVDFVYETAGWGTWIRSQ
jgi:hypothetical protein